MATSQNKWPVHTDSSGLVPLKWITGRVAPGHVHYLFSLLCERYHREVEPITAAHSWGYAYRPVRGSTTGLSNHASGTAIDLNAPKHPLGRRGTFTPKQVAAIRAILADLGGVVRWGGDYSGRPDEMHFELNATPAAVAQAVRKIRQGDDDMASAKDEILQAIRDSQRAIGLAIRDTRKQLKLETNEIDRDLDKIIEQGKD